ncbi:Magnesium transporter MgtE [Poriferisphaera corsica]|uniref:Magnesium transporter MgtE n=1 Tax=Poriferisphaera corsica TaxID=2528020 RepID=A0A517YS14_9BACT|nr:magnesium transporter [Poriferisphaera corsica]QDU33014.1 Magnesium transporter MgtE [Poriferisphaera corsica]
MHEESRDISGSGKFVREENDQAIRTLFEGVHPAQVADELSLLNEQDIWYAMRVLGVDNATRVFQYFDEDLQVRLASGEHRRMMAKMLEEMDHDDRADLVSELDEDVKDRLLPLVAHAEREDIRRLASYGEGTTGAIMSSDYASVRPGMTVEQTIQTLRLEAPDRETIYYVYVIDGVRHLVGFVELKDLIRARPNQKVEDVMKRDVIHVTVGTDQEETARMIGKYDVIALPVVDAHHELVGIVTYDDAIDVIKQEQTEDFEKFMAIGGEHEAGTYLKTNAFRHFHKRVYWIVGLAAVELVSGLVIHSYEDALTTLVLLALYMPMITDTGGNTGSQSATVVIRALALGEIRPNFVGLVKVFRKEIIVAGLMAIVLMFLSFGKVLFLSYKAVLPGEFTLSGIGSVIALALGIQVLSATMIGALLPMIAARCKLDPAVVASPALTTLVDITGLLIYFGTARMLLGV